MTVASAYVKSLTRGSSTDRGVSATTGCAQHMTARPAMVMAPVTVGSVSVMRTGSESPASTRSSAASPTGRAKTCAATHRAWCAPTQAPVTAAAVCAVTPMARA